MLELLMRETMFTLQLINVSKLRFWFRIYISNCILWARRLFAAKACWSCCRRKRVFTQTSDQEISLLPKELLHARPFHHSSRSTPPVIHFHYDVTVFTLSFHIFFNVKLKTFQLWQRRIFIPSSLHDRTQIDLDFSERNYQNCLIIMAFVSHQQDKTCSDFSQTEPSDEFW